MANYNGTAVNVVDEESHRSEDMLKIVGNGVDRWVFAEEVDISESVPTDPVSQ